MEMREEYSGEQQDPDVSLRQSFVAFGRRMFLSKVAMVVAGAAVATATEILSEDPEKLHIDEQLNDEGEGTIRAVFERGNIQLIVLDWIPEKPNEPEMYKYAFSVAPQKQFIAGERAQTHPVTFKTGGLVTGHSWVLHNANQKQKPAHQQLEKPDERFILEQRRITGEGFIIESNALSNGVHAVSVRLNNVGAFPALATEPMKPGMHVEVLEHTLFYQERSMGNSVFLAEKKPFKWE